MPLTGLTQAGLIDLWKTLSSHCHLGRRGHSPYLHPADAHVSCPASLASVSSGRSNSNLDNLEGQMSQNSGLGKRCWRSDPRGEDVMGAQRAESPVHSLEVGFTPFPDCIRVTEACLGVRGASKSRKKVLE